VNLGIREGNERLFMSRSQDWMKISFATRATNRLRPAEHDKSMPNIARMSSELGSCAARCRYIGLVGEHEMSTMKTLGLAIGLAFAASSFAFAQQGNPPPAPGDQGNPAANAAASGGGGTHHDSLKTGTAQSSQKILRNQQGYRHVYSYYRGGRCHLLHRPGSRHLVRICH
jgi:hypothetical protein